MALERKAVPELINVHQVYAHKDVIRFLKNSDKEFVEGLFYQAKRYGRAEFEFSDVSYVILRNRDFSFTIEENPDTDLSTEAFS